MALTHDQLIQKLSARVDPTFAREAVQSYIEMERRFLAGDWQPAELDGGRLCEAVAKAVYQLDTGLIDHTLLPGAATDYLVKQKNVPHELSDKDRRHISKAIEVVYKFRSDRGPVHISPVHTANYMDSMFVLHAGKWILAEFLRLAWTQDRTVIGETISQLVQLEHSLVHELDGKPLVLSNSVSTGEEVLLLLYSAPAHRLSKSDIRSYAHGRTSNAISTAISRLLASREVRGADNGDIALTPLGEKKLRESIIPKLSP